MPKARYAQMSEEMHMIGRLAENIELFLHSIHLKTYVLTI